MTVCAVRAFDGRYLIADTTGKHLDRIRRILSLSFDMDTPPAFGLVTPAAPPRV